VQALLLVSQANLAQLVQQAETAQDPERALARSRDKALRPAEQALKAAQTVGDKQLEAFAQYVFGQAAVETMQLKEAEKANLDALALFRECGDQSGEAAATCQTAEMHFQAKRFDKMREAADKALALALACQDGTAEARARAILKKMQAPPQAFPIQGQHNEAEEKDMHSATNDAIPAGKEEPANDDEAVANAITDEASLANTPSEQLWEVVGGGAAGGLLVRTGKDLESPKLNERLTTCLDGHDDHDAWRGGPFGPSQQ